ncbi:MAG TPA: M23 family metallopeptidase [Vulgatibacter sp.]|nr:M23 family metallopeptidase [Vulgatibacter sp.]
MFSRDPDSAPLARRLAPLLATLLAAASCTQAPREEATPPAPPEPEPPPALVPERTYEVRSDRIQPNDTIVGALARVGVDVGVANEVVRSLDGIFDFRKARVGDELRVTVEDDVLQLFEYRRGPVEEYRVSREGDRLVGAAREFVVEKEEVRVEGVLETSLWDAIAGAGADPQVAMALADVLAWDVDFYLDPRKGDSFRFVIERFVNEGRTVRWGDIVAAEYDGQQVGKKRVFRYPNPKTGALEYYAENGGAARRAFLKSPLKFAFISSRFGSRVHPILKYRKQHQGVDYAAGTGTPVWAVADGTVTRAGWDPACGNMVSIRHANGFDTVYCHFSRIAKGVRKGARVAQKAVIGYVGATGRATGPHLHYGVKRGGKFVNPLQLKFPPSDPLPPDEMPRFAEAISPMLELLDDPKLAAAPHEIGTVGP